MSPQYGELRPTSGWDRLISLGHPCKFQLVSRLGSITARHLVVGVSQTLRRWTEGATYIRQGDHHVGHWPIFLVQFIVSRHYVRQKVSCSFVRPSFAWDHGDATATDAVSLPIFYLARSAPLAFHMLPLLYFCSAALADVRLSFSSVRWLLSPSVTRSLYIWWQWRNFLVTYLCRLFFPAMVWGKLWEMFAIVTPLCE